MFFDKKKHKMNSCIGHVNNPPGGSSVHIGSDIMIMWNYTSPVQGAATVDIELRDASSGTPLHTVATNVPNLGFYFWSVDTHLSARTLNFSSLFQKKNAHNVGADQHCVLFVGRLLDASAGYCVSDSFHVVRVNLTDRIDEHRDAPLW